jgi:hypothetical protein
VGGKAY